MCSTSPFNCPERYCVGVTFMRASRSARRSCTFVGCHYSARMHILLLLLLLPWGLHAQARASAPLAVTRNCSMCATWNLPHAPVTLHGNTHYVGTNGLSAILITSPAGHILIDGALRESAPLIAASIRGLGFRLEDVKLILNTHVHYDHAGGIGLLQRATGARVAALGPAARVLRSGVVGRDDPQFEIASPIDPVARVREIKDRDTLQVGNITVTAHRTAGHTPGGTTWTWQSCDSAGCRDMVYADSQTPVSSDNYRFTGTMAVRDFQEGQARIESLSCDILMTPHPEASGLFERVAAMATNPGALVDREACKRYAAAGRERLAARLAAEVAKR